MRAVEHPLLDLWEDLSSNLGPAPRRSERVAKGKKRPFSTTQLDTCDEDLSWMGDPKTLGTIRAFTADGAYSKALKHLL